MRRLPNLNQLRAFEAAARHLSFKDAADELFVTQAAVSHQIKALEQDFGLPLFIRRGREVSLTADALQLYSELTPALDQIADAAAAFKSTKASGSLKISMSGFFANRVVRPRLGEFKTLHPELQVEFSYSREIVDFGATDFDAAIVYGPGKKEGLSSIPICIERTAVCTPSLVEGLELPVPAEEVAKLPLATTKNHTTGWLDWFAAAGVDDISDSEFIEFADGGLAFDFAATGEGVALIADLPLVEHELSTGALIVVNPLKITLNYGIYLFYPETQTPAQKILAFADWLHSVSDRLKAS